MQLPFASRNSLLSLLSVLVSAFLISGSTLSHAQDDPPPQAGRLSSLSGAVSLQPAGADDWSQASPNYPIGPGDRIFTDSDGRAEIQIGQNYVRIGPNSDVTFVEFDPQNVTFGVAQGTVHVRTRGLWNGQSLYVQTPSGGTTVGGPADFRVDVMPAEPAAIFTTYSGDVNISAAGGSALTRPAASRWSWSAAIRCLRSGCSRRARMIWIAGASRAMNRLCAQLRSTMSALKFPASTISMRTDNGRPAPIMAMSGSRMCPWAGRLIATGTGLITSRGARCGLKMSSGDMLPSTSAAGWFTRDDGAGYRVRRRPVRCGHQRSLSLRAACKPVAAQFRRGFRWDRAKLTGRGIPAVLAT